MSSSLTKDTSSILIPGIPGTPDTPGTAGTAARQAYCITQTSYRQSYITTYIIVPPDPYTSRPSRVVALTSGGGLVPVTTTTCYPYVPAVPPLAGKPGIPPVLPSAVLQFNLGWDAGARSIDSLVADGSASFSVPVAVTGVIAGLCSSSLPTNTYSEVQHGLYFRSGFVSAIELGVIKSSSLPYIGTDVFSITRSGGIVRYFQNATLIYTSATPSAGTMFLDSSLYRGGDEIDNAAITATIDATINVVPGKGSVAFLPMATLGGAAQATSSNAFGAPTSASTGFQAQGGIASMAPMQAIASVGPYSISGNQFVPLTMTAEGGLLAPTLSLAAAAFYPLLNFAHGLTEGTTIKPSTSLGDSAALWVPNQWAGYTATITSGTGVGQSIVIADNTQQSLLFNSAWSIAPDGTSTYTISLDGIVYYSGTATPGGNYFAPLISIGSNYKYGMASASFAPITSFSAPLVPLNGYAFLTCPSFTVTASGTGYDIGGFNGVMPTFTLKAFGGANANLKIPRWQLTASGTVANVGRAALTMSMGTLTASGKVGGIAESSLTLVKGYTVRAFSGAVAAVTLQDGYTVTASGKSGSVLRAAISMPLFELTASGTGRTTLNGAMLTMPMLRPVPSSIARLVLPGYILTAAGFATVTTTYEGYSINLLGENTGQVTHYTNFPFNQIVRFNGHYYGVADDGLYLMEGDMDGATPIPWMFETCLDAMGTRELKRVPSMYISGRIDGEIDVKVIVGERSDQEYHYRAVGGANAQTYRVKIGRGLKSRYWGFGLSDEGGSFCEVDMIDPEVQKLERSI